MMIKRLITGVLVASTLSIGSVSVAEPVSSGTINIPITEYEKLKEASHAKEDKQYWNMTFEQILDVENNNTEKAWALYEYYVLRNVYLNTVVSGGSVDTLIKDFNVLAKLDNTKPINLIIQNSPGGSVYDGLNLITAMNNSPVDINTECDGMAASMAAVILVAGDNRVANQGCHWMIHEVGAGAPGGQTIDHIKWGEFILDIENILMEILSENTGLSIKDVRALGEYETFYDANEILQLGVVDEVRYNGRKLVPGSHTIPDDLLPLNRMKNNLNERLTK